jgi:hypothetical protein
MNKDAKIFHKKLKRIEHCEKITGKETIEQLAALMFTPQGREFCIENNFPYLGDLREIDKKELEKHNVYVDKNFTCTNVEKVAVFGNSHAVLNYDNVEKSYHVIAMHGAKVKIIASGYSVVFVESKGADIIVEKRDKAKGFV